MVRPLTQFDDSMNTSLLAAFGEEVQNPATGIWVRGIVDIAVVIPGNIDDVGGAEQHILTCALPDKAFAKAGFVLRGPIIVRGRPRSIGEIDPTAESGWKTLHLNG